MLKFIGKVIRLDFLLVISTILFAIILAIGYKLLWIKVVGWIEPARVFSASSTSFYYATEPPHSLLDIVKQPIWLSFWLAIVTWWLILFALIARKSGAGGGTIYATSTAWNSQIGTVTVNTPVGYVAPDEEEGRSFFFGALCFGVVLIILTVLPGIAVSALPDSGDPYRTNFANPTISSAKEGLDLTIGLIVMLAIPLSFVAFPIAGKLIESGSSLMRVFRKFGYIVSATMFLQALAWAVIFVLCATNLVDTSNAAVAAYEQSYIKEMPSVDKVLADMQTSDPFDSTARQCAAFNHLDDVIEIMSEGRIPFGDTTATPEESRIYNLYRSAAAQAQGIGQSKFGGNGHPGTDPDPQDRNWTTTMWQIQSDPTFHDELFKRYFSPDWQARYLRAKKVAASQ